MSTYFDSHTKRADFVKQTQDLKIQDWLFDLMNNVLKYLLDPFNLDTFQSCFALHEIYKFWQITYIHKYLVHNLMLVSAKAKLFYEATFFVIIFTYLR